MNSKLKDAGITALSLTAFVGFAIVAAPLIVVNKASGAALNVLTKNMT